MQKQLNQLDKILKKAKKDIVKIKDKTSLESFRVDYLGRKSTLTKSLRTIKDIPAKHRAEIGQKSNQIRVEIENLYKTKEDEIRDQETQEEHTYFDVTAPGKSINIGHVHPLTQLVWDIEDIFTKMGFEVFEPYDLDDDYHNFTSINIPEGHPARDIWDTFWTEDGFIPITHTSSMQNRILRTREVPVRAVVIGNTFRNERTDARHEHTLMQCEGVYVDKGITLADMIGTLKEFFSNIFGKRVEAQVTPDYFPFVEPGNGMALSCIICDMKGCRVCKGTGWLEILGCGMIHPNVLSEGGINSNVYSGFAWGFGIDRLTMLKHSIEDVRHFRTGDLRFIRQF